MNRVLIALLLFFIAVITSAGVGYFLQSNNPEGIWLYMPPVDGSGRPVNIFYVGVYLGLLFFSIIYSLGFLSAFIWSKLKRSALPFASIPMALVALIGFILVAVLLECPW